METIIVSACLVGDKCRYDGKDNFNELIKELHEYYDIVPVCPEVFGGLKIPRDPAELKNGRAYNKNGKDVTNFYINGIDKIIGICRYFHVQKAILTEKSPACGVHKIHNGRFNGGLVDGEGLLTTALKRLNIEVFTIEEAQKLLDEKRK